MADFKITEHGNLLTPAGIAVYPHLNDPDFEYKKEHGEFHCKLAFDAASEEAIALMAQVDEACEAAWDEHRAELKGAKLKNVKRASPPYAMEQDEEGDETGRVLFKFKTAAGGKGKRGPWKRKVDLFDSQLSPTEANVGGGSVLRVKAELMGYNSPAVGIGVSMKLQAVQIIELKEYSGGSGSSGFEATEGFVAAPAVPAGETDSEGKWD